MDTSQIILAFLSIGLIGGVLGAVLAYASKVFYVAVDPKVEKIAEVLPQANCGACGYPDCATLAKQKKKSVEFTGPICSFRLLDMGIALGSAVKTASMLNVDNRIMYRVGAVVREMKLVDWEFVMGIPLSVTGKSIYFDR